MYNRECNIGSEFILTVFLIMLENALYYIAVSSVEYILGVP